MQRSLEIDDVEITFCVRSFDGPFSSNFYSVHERPEAETDSLEGSCIKLKLCLGGQLRSRRRLTRTFISALFFREFRHSSTTITGFSLANAIEQDSWGLLPGCERELWGNRDIHYIALQHMTLHYIHMYTRTHKRDMHGQIPLHIHIQLCCKLISNPNIAFLLVNIWSKFCVFSFSVSSKSIFLLQGEWDASTEAAKNRVLNWPVLGPDIDSTFWAVWVVPSVRKLLRNEFFKNYFAQWLREFRAIPPKWIFQECSGATMQRPLRKQMRKSMRLKLCECSCTHPMSRFAALPSNSCSNPTAKSLHCFSRFPQKCQLLQCF